MPGIASTLARELTDVVRGDVRFDAGTRAMYSTDASNYRAVPIGVVVPRSTEDVLAALDVCRRHDVPVLPRGAATSIAGQTCNVAVVIDFARHLDRVLDIDPDRSLARLQPGVVLDTLQSAAGPYGLAFGPDPSTHSRCTLGGMIGNNACGSHSVAWGKTVDNVESLDVVLYDGTRLTVGATPDDDLARLCAREDRIGTLHRDLRALRDTNAERIRQSFPRLDRRVSGYNLDQLLPEHGFDLARALVGTEGSCATILGATVRLVRPPTARALAVLGFADRFAAADNVVGVLDLNPLTVEGIDAALVAAFRAKNPRSRAAELLPAGESWLLVETGGETPAEAAARAREVTRYGATGVVLTAPEQRRALWRVREEGAGTATRLADGTEAWSGWEDAAVPPHRLGAYLREFDRLMREHDRRGVVYGHFGDGCLHVRIDFDLHSDAGVAGYRRFMTDAAELVVSHGGSLSGEHGDGQARAELLPRMFPPEIIEAFGQFKAAFDPRDRMNPGKIVRPRRLDDDLRVHIAPPTIPTRARLALDADDGDLAAASRRCAGVGTCLNATGGVMCPSYRATREERHSTRGRARLLFELLHGDVVTDGWRSAEVREALDLCLSCKGCKSDCPVNVDMASYKAEFLSRHYHRRIRPASHYSMGYLPLWLALGARTPWLVNRITGGQAGGLLKRLGGIAPERAIPALAPRTFQAAHHASRPESPQPDVMLWPDTFTNHFDPDIGHDAVGVLESLGLSVAVPRQRVCCGLTWLSTGQLGTARRVLRRTLRVLAPALDRKVPIVGLEPSCTAFLRYDAAELLPEARRLADGVRTFAEVLDEHRSDWTVRNPGQRAMVQVHCHQHAELGFDADRRVLDDLDVTADVLDSGCCGLAGNFGFERGHYDVSMACAEQALLPAIRADTDATVLADGFSCRTQVSQATDTQPVHLATLAARALGVSAEDQRWLSDRRTV
ncbi:MAG: FAD-binding protein [Actinophytocola sp.]|nr:FAD-binding protein [Actinophytocola sp.]